MTDAKLYASVRFKDRLALISSDVREGEQNANLSVTALVHARHRTYGECHSRYALPEALFAILDKFHPLVKIAVAHAVLEAEKASLERVDVTVEGNRVTARWK